MPDMPNTDETHACLHCYVLDGSGAAQPVDIKTLAADDPRQIWIHLNALHKDTRKLLKDQLALDATVVKTLLADETRPRVEETQYGSLVMLRSVNHNPGPEPEDLVSLRLWVSENRIITVSRRRALAIADLQDRFRDEHGPRQIGEFLAMLCNCVNDGIEPALQDLEERIDTLEELSGESPDANLRNDLSSVRKQATQFRRHISPLRDVVSRLPQSEHVRMSATDKWNIHDSLDRLTRFVEELDSIRERSQILQDEVYNAMSARLNRNLYVLSVITAVFMPLTFISGLLGMNVDGIPGSSNPKAFLAVCGISAALALFQIGLFRRLKWF